MCHVSNVLEAKGLYKCFGENAETETTVLNNVSFHIARGEFVAIMGRSGSEKSTLLYNISGMDRMTDGEVIFDGQDISKMLEEHMAEVRLKDMGFIFQQAYLLKNMTIEDNILLPGYKAGKETKEQVMQRCRMLMKKLDIEQIADHDMTQVSGGQLQRATIARALMNHPKILFGDEPTGSLNSGTTIAVMDIMNQINEEGTSILLVTHDAKVAARADRVVFLADGKVEAECILGRYVGNQTKLRTREEQLAAFLEDRGF